MKPTTKIHTLAVNQIAEQSAELPGLVANATNGVEHSHFQLKRSLRLILEAMTDLEPLTEPKT
jgi:hypothetical protein